MNYFDGVLFSIIIFIDLGTILTVWYLPFHWFRNYFDSGVFSILFSIDLWTILTMWYFLLFLSLIYELFWQCGIFYYLFHWFRNYFDSGIFYYLFHWFRNYFDSRVFSIFFFIDLGTILTVCYFLLSFSLI